MRPVLAVLLTLPLVACGAGGPRPAPDGVGAIVLVSGRDDHGLLQVLEVPLYAEPEGSEIAARLADGAFAEVVEIHGTWLRIRSVAEPSRSGWIDDFFLRDRAVLHDAQQVRFLDARVGGGGAVEVEVQAVEGDAPAQWVPEDQLVEVGADVEPHDH